MRLVDAPEIVCWARAKGSTKTSLQHAWRRLEDGELATRCGIHAGGEPVRQTHIIVRLNRVCRLCRRHLAKSSTPPGTLAALLASARTTTGAGELFQWASTLTPGQLRNEFSLEATLAAVAQALQDDDATRLGTAIGNQVVALVAAAKKRGVQTTSAFLTLAHRHEWFGTFDDCLQSASLYAIEHPGRPRRLLMALAASCRAIQGRGARRNLHEHVGRQVYYLVALASQNSLNAVECIRTALRRLEPAQEAALSLKQGLVSRSSLHHGLANSALHGDSEPSAHANPS